MADRSPSPPVGPPNRMGTMGATLNNSLPPPPPPPPPPAGNRNNGMPPPPARRTTNRNRWSTFSMGNRQSRRISTLSTSRRNSNFANHRISYLSTCGSVDGAVPHYDNMYDAFYNSQFESTFDLHDPFTIKPDEVDGKDVDLEFDGAIEPPPEYGVDPNLVEWDGTDDPANPYNWPYGKRMGYVVIAGLTAFFANMTATAFAPAAQSLRDEFGIKDPTLSSLTVTIYLLGFALGPIVIAPLSEHYGRRWVYTVCLTFGIAFLIGCSQANDTRTFLVCRLITGIAGSGPGTIGGGTIADVMPKDQRGGAMAIFAIGPLLSHTIGPLFAGPTAYYLGWRWLFRIIYIATICIFAVSLIFTKETYAPVILQNKAKRLRKKTGNPELYSKYDHKGSPLKALQFSISRPMRLLFFSPIVLSLSVYCAFVWGLLILLFTTFPATYEGQYGFKQTIIGTAYLGMGIGMAIGAVSFGVISDKIAKKRKAGQGKEWTPEARLQLMVWFSPVSPIGFFWFGWAAYTHTHWIVPILGTSLIGFGALYIVMPTQMYLVDAFGPAAAASAIAANTVLRSFAAAFLPLAGPKLYEKLGLGWGNTLLGFMGLTFCILPVLFFKYGSYMRERWPISS